MTLLTFITILTVADMLALIADLVILYKYCNAGFLGYPDEWYSPKAEKAHYALAPAVLVLSIIITVLAVSQRLFQTTSNGSIKTTTTTVVGLKKGWHLKPQKEYTIKNKDIMEQKQNNNIPEIGKEYHFFDDGKKSPSRHYICKCERVITPEEAKGIVFDLDDRKTTLYDIWKNESSKCDFLFAKDTDYFVEVSCPSYDENNLWAVRTKDGGWFTLDVQTGWQGGRIDVTGEIFDNVVEFWTKEGEMGMVDGYLEATYN